MPKSEWSETETLTLRRLWNTPDDTTANGLVSTAEIGRRMGYGKNSIVGKAHRLGLPPRPSPIRRNNGAPNLPRQRTNSRRVTPTVTLSSMAEPPIEISEIDVSLGWPPASPLPVVAKPPPRRRKRLPDALPLGRETCCFPIGEPRTSGFRFCDDPALLGKPYCQAHCKVAYIKRSETPEGAFIPALPL